MNWFKCRKNQLKIPIEQVVTWLTNYDERDLMKFSIEMSQKNLRIKSDELTPLELGFLILIFKEFALFWLIVAILE